MNYTALSTEELLSHSDNIEALTEPDKEKLIQALRTKLLEHSDSSVCNLDELERAIRQLQEAADNVEQITERFKAPS